MIPRVGSYSRRPTGGPITEVQEKCERPSRGVRARGGLALRRAGTHGRQRDELSTSTSRAGRSRDETGAVVFLVPSASVITERKQTENALREINEKFHLLADNITDAFWIRSPDMREVHYISPAFERIWGRSAASLLPSAEVGRLRPAGRPAAGGGRLRHAQGEHRAWTSSIASCGRRRDPVDSCPGFSGPRCRGQN